MVLNEINNDGYDQEDNKCLEPDVIAKGNILESFTESQETKELINHLRLVYKDLTPREKVLEKFIGKR